MVYLPRPDDDPHGVYANVATRTLEGAILHDIVLAYVGGEDQVPQADGRKIVCNVFGDKSTPIHN
jgi:hypothetical protein